MKVEEVLKYKRFNFIIHNICIKLILLALTEGGRNLLNQGNNQSLLIPIDVRHGGDNDISRYNSTGIPTPQTTARNLPDGDYFGITLIIYFITRYRSLL